MTQALYVDISEHQPEHIDWKAYVAWSRQGDGIARVALRSSYGTGFVDAKYRAYLEGARAAGVDMVFHYHYAYPQYNPRPEDEADWQFSIVGDLSAYPNDVYMLDMEENVVDGQSTDSAWALAWLQRQEKNTRRIPVIYASASMVANRLQNGNLTRYPLILATWNYDPSSPPPSPGPWATYRAWQYSDKLSGVPGFGSAVVDSNVFLGGQQMTFTNNGMVMDLRKSYQLTDGESQDRCGPWSVAELRYAGPPTKGPTGSSEDIHRWAHIEYEKYIGPDITSDQNGSSVENMHQFMADTKLHYWDIDAITPASSRANDIARIKRALDSGYPVLVTVNELSVIRKDGSNPYPWQPGLGPVNHVFTIVGHTSDGFFLVADELNQSDAWPDKYKQSALEIHWASVVQVIGPDAANPWLKTIPKGDPLQYPAGFSAQTDTMLGEIMGAPKGWKLSADGKKLTAPNGVDVVLGFKDKVLNSTWDAGNVPLFPQKGVPSVQFHASFGPGDVQFFRDGMLWYTKAKGVIWESQLGAEIYARTQAMDQLATQRDQLLEQVATLNQTIVALTAQVGSVGGITPELQAVINSGMATLQTIEATIDGIEALLQPYVKE